MTFDSVNHFSGFRDLFLIDFFDNNSLVSGKYMNAVLNSLDRLTMPKRREDFAENRL